jgi:hypothetical protein
MSITSGLATAVGAYSTLKSLFGDASISLAGIPFKGFELPEKVTFGGQQQLVIHKMPGGNRVIDSLGPDEKDIEWSGSFTGIDAVSRAKQFDALRIAGRQVILSWSEFRRKVVISSFDCDYQYNGNYMPYRIKLVVIANIDLPSKPSLLSALNSDLSKALGFNVLGTAQTAITVAQKALVLAPLLIKNSPALNSVTSVVSQASTALTLTSASANSQLSNLGSTSSISSGTFGASAAVIASSAQSTLASVTNAGAYVGRALSNLGNVT